MLFIWFHEQHVLIDNNWYYDSNCIYLSCFQRSGGDFFVWPGIYFMEVPNKLLILSAATRAADFIGHQDVNQFENGMQYRDDIGSVVAVADDRFHPKFRSKSKHDSIILWWFWCRTSLWYQWYLYLTFNWSKVTFCHRFKRLIPVLETRWALGVRPAQKHSAILVPNSGALKQFRASRVVQPLPASCSFLYHTCLYQTNLYQICPDSTCGYPTCLSSCPLQTVNFCW